MTRRSDLRSPLFRTRVRSADRRAAHATAIRGRSRASAQLSRDRYVRRLRRWSASASRVWAARRGTEYGEGFYAAGGGLSGLQNGLAIAGDYTSAATFLGVTALVYTSGYDGMIYAIGFLVGFPMILFLIAEPLRNLGRYTFADVVAYRLSERRPVARRRRARW